MDLKLELPPEYPKPRFVVDDRLVEAARKFWGDAVEVIPLSETYLPADSASAEQSSESEG